MVSAIRLRARTLAERHTIADSKRAFHEAFPHVIAPLYRRVADELLVELHLLSHQKGFEANNLFAIGLNTFFERFTQGYRPAEHSAALLSALCSSNGFDAAQLRTVAQECMQDAKSQSDDERQGWLNDQNLSDGAHYSRLMAVGLLAVLETASSETDAAALRQRAVDLSSELGLPAERVEKDLTVFSSNCERMEQAVELMQETLAAERRKKEKRLAEATQGKPS